MAILTNPTGVATGQTTADGTVTTDAAGGSVYVVVTQSPTQPTAAQIEAGQSETDSAADWSEFSPIVTRAGVVAFKAIGLSPTTTYYFHFVQDNPPFGPQSNIVTSPSFLTQGADWLARTRSRNVIVREAL